MKSTVHGLMHRGWLKLWCLKLFTWYELLLDMNYSTHYKHWAGHFKHLPVYSTLPEVAICVFHKWILQISSETIFNGQCGCWNKPSSDSRFRIFYEIWGICSKLSRLTWMQQLHITSFHSFKNSFKRRMQNYYKCECCWSFDNDELVSKCKEIVLKLS